MANYSSTINQKEKRVEFGDWATVKLPDGSIKEFTVVHTSEIDVLAGKISNESPIGQALLGAKEGEKRTYNVAGRLFEFEVLSIKKGQESDN